MSKRNTTVYTTIGLVVLVISLVALKGTLKWVGLGMSMLFLTIAIFKQLSRK